MTYNSRATYTASPSNAYAIPFPYLDGSDVKVYVGLGADAVSVAFTFLSPTSVALAANPSAPESVTVQRQTDVSELRGLTLGDIFRSATNNLNFTRLLYAVQELYDGAGGGSGQVVVIGGGSGGSTAWTDITGKPGTFPPSAHSHAQSDITGLLATLANKADISLANVSDEDFAAKASSAGVGTDEGLGTFDSSTTYRLGASGDGYSLRSTVQRFLDNLNVCDFGAIGDGVTDCTAALNAYIAAVNAGITKEINWPRGRFVISGNVTAITKGFSWNGRGTGATVIIGGAGTSPLVNAPDIPGTGVDGRVSIFGCAFESTAYYVRGVMDIGWATSLVASQERLSIVNVDIQKWFLKGIKLKNVIGGSFTNVYMQGGPTSDVHMEYGWYVTADIGHYSVACIWQNCNCATALTCWKVDRHAEGFYWTQCQSGFSDIGWDLQLTDTGAAPEFHITDCQCEVNLYGIKVKNAAYVTISDYSFYVDPSATPNRDAIRLEDVFSANIHHNNSIAFTDPGNYTFLRCMGTTNNVLVQGNRIGFLGSTGTGVHIQDTANNIIIKDNHYYAVQSAAAKLWNDTTGGSTNKFSGATTDSAVAQFAATVEAGTTGAVSPVNTIPAIFAQVGAEMRKGETWRIEVLVQMIQPTVAMQTVNMRIREYNHRPAAAVPFDVFHFSKGRTSINDTRILSQSTVQRAARFAGCFDVHIVGTALDALIILELFTDAGTCTADEFLIRCTRL